MCVCVCDRESAERAQAKGFCLPQHDYETTNTDVGQKRLDDTEKISNSRGFKHNVQPKL